MSSKISFGFVGDMERYVARRFIESDYQELGYETKLYIERLHRGNTRGQYFNDIDEILSNEDFLEEYKSYEDYKKQWIEEFPDDEVAISDELKEALQKLEANETLYLLDNNSSTTFGTDKEKVILEGISDGQYQLLFSNTDEIIEAINNPDNEAATVHIYNTMANYERNKFLDEYELKQSTLKDVLGTVKEIVNDSEIMNEIKKATNSEAVEKAVDVVNYLDESKAIKPETISFQNENKNKNR